jgi:hypothetical protein
MIHVVACCNEPVLSGAHRSAPTESIWKLRLDIGTAKILVWAARVGRDAELTPNTHLYFAGRYQQLGDYHRKQGNKQRADRLHAKATLHYKLGGGHEHGPYTAAIAMPRPRQWIITDAVSGRNPDDAA